MEKDSLVYEMMIQLSYLMREPHVRVDQKNPKFIAGVDMTLLLFLMDSVPLAEIARRLYVTGGAVTHKLDRLERLGYIKRINHPRGDNIDRRLADITITKKGLNKFWERMNATIAESNEILSALTKEELETYAMLTSRMYKHSTSTP